MELLNGKATRSCAVKWPRLQISHHLCWSLCVLLICLLFSGACSRNVITPAVGNLSEYQYGLSGRGRLVLAWDKDLGRALGNRLEITELGAAATTLDGHLKLLTIADGDELWGVRKSEGLQSGARRAGTSLVCIEDSPGNRIYCLRAADGARLWERPQAETLGAPLVAGQRLYTASRSGVVQSRDLDTGKENWYRQYPGPVRTALTRVDSLIFIATISDTLMAISAETGDFIWGANPSGALYGPPVYSGSQLWTISYLGVLSAWDVDSGDQVHRMQLPGSFRTGLTANDDQLFAISTTGTLFAIDCISRSITWQEDFDRIADVALTIQNDLLWIPLRSGAIHARRLVDGKQMATLLVPPPVSTPVLAVGAYILVGAGQGRVIAFRFSSGLGSNLHDQLIAPVHSGPKEMPAQIAHAMPSTSEESSLRFAFLKENRNQPPPLLVERVDLNSQTSGSITPPRFSDLGRLGSHVDFHGGLGGRYQTSSYSSKRDPLAAKSISSSINGQLHFSSGLVWTTGWLAGTALALWCQHEADQQYDTYLHTGSTGQREDALDQSVRYDNLALVSWVASEICFVMALRSWLGGSK